MTAIGNPLKGVIHEQRTRRFIEIPKTIMIGGISIHEETSLVIA